MVKLMPFDPTVDDADTAWPGRGDVDDQSLEIVKFVQGKTMTIGYKLLCLIDAVRYVAKNSVPGAIVECGVWKGGSIAAAALALRDSGDMSRDLYLFDTFNGMTEPNDLDVRLADGVSAISLLATSDSTSHAWAVAGLQEVKELMKLTGYTDERVHYVSGDVCKTLPRDLGPIAILRLDTDWYESTRHELESLYDQVVPGGVIIFDDYGCWGGARRAVDEFFAARALSPFLIRVVDGRFMIKVP